jgi:quercetin dioxygenase-like cupin family protein
MSVARGAKDAREEKYPGRTIRTLLDPKTVGTDGLVLATITYDPGCEVEPHTHDDQEAIYVIEGRGRAKVGDESVELEPGTAVYIAKGVTHSVVNPNDEPIEAVLVHAPARDQ